MIGRQQLLQLGEELLHHTIRTARRLPVFAELVRYVNQRLPRGLGQPSAPEVAIDDPARLPTAELRQSYRALAWDLRVLADEYNRQVAEAARLVRALRTRLASLTWRISELGRKMKLLEPRVSGAVWVLYDTLTEPAMVDWANTTALVDLAAGTARCRYRSEATLTLDPAAANVSERGLYWLLDEPVQLNGIFVQTSTPLQLELWLGDTRANRWILAASGLVSGGRLWTFPAQETDTVELVVKGNAPDRLMIERMILVRLRYTERAVYRTAKLRLDASSWRTDRLEGEIRAEAIGTTPGGTNLNAKLIVYQKGSDQGAYSQHGDRYYIGLSESSYRPDWTRLERDSAGLLLLPFPGVARTSLLRLYLGERQYLFRVVPEVPVLHTETGPVVPIPDRSSLDSDGAWHFADQDEVVIYQHSGRYGLAPADTLRGCPLIRVGWKDQLWTGCVVGVTASADLANPASIASVPGVPLDSDLCLKCWIRLDLNNTPRVRVAALSLDKPFPAAVSVWWNGTLLGSIGSGCVGDPVSEWTPSDYRQWNLLELVVRNGQSLPAQAGAKLVLWRVDGAIDYGTSNQPLAQVTPSLLMLEPRGQVPRSWYAYWSANGELTAILPFLPDPIRLYGYSAARPDLRLVATGLSELPEWVQAEVELVSDGKETPLLEGVRISLF